MNKMDRQEMRTILDGRSQVCDVTNYNDVTKIDWETSSATSRARHERLNCVLVLSSGRKIVHKSCFFSVYF